MESTFIHGSEAISRIIPQRAPFVLVDTIHWHREKEVLSGFEIPADHILVNEQGFLTEAGIIENIAQTIALYQGYYYYIRNLQAPLGYIGAVKNISICQLPKAGQTLETQVSVLQEILDVTMVQGEVRCQGQLIAQGEIRTIIAKKHESL